MTPQERLRAWGAEPVGEPWSTPSSTLAAGVRGGLPVVVKVAGVEEEVLGNGLLAWWDGRGAVPVLEHDGDAVLMLRATGGRDLAVCARSGRDAEATAVLVDAALALHANGVPPASVPLVPLRRWFRELLEAPQPEPLHATAAALAEELLASTTDADVVALHGDVHHGNVLDLGDAWAAIDPKALLGHRAFDVANILCNPDLETATRHLEDRLDVVVDRSGLDRDTVIRWTFAWCGLSDVWMADEPSTDPRAVRAIADRLRPRV